MNQRFVTDAAVDLPPMVRHRAGCGCALHARRRLGGALLGSGLLAGVPAWAQDAAPAPAPAGGPDPECRRAKVSGLVPADQIEGAAAQQYRQMLQQAASNRDHDRRPALESESNEQTDQQAKADIGAERQNQSGKRGIHRSIL